MFRPFYVFIGKRYVQLQRKNHAIAFFSLVSMIGIALGVAVLITVTSVMNGFGREIRAELLSGEPHITFSNQDGKLSNWQTLTKQVQDIPLITGAAPYVLGQGLINFNGTNHGLMVQGVDFNTMDNVFPLSTKVLASPAQQKNLLPGGKFNILLGRQLADNLGINIGDKITVMIPDTLISPAGVMPRMKQFTVAGIFDVTRGFNLSHALINLEDGQKLFHMGDTVSGLQIKIDDPLLAYSVSAQLYKQYGQSYWVSNWMQRHETYLRAINMEKVVMSCILLLIVAVAAFNLVSSLVMMVADKQPDISILRAMGATPRQIMAIFVVQGSLIGVVGIIMGVIGGLILTWNATAAVDFIQKVLGYALISRDTYFISYLPTEIHYQDIAAVVAVALFLSIVATLYPAYRAANLQPAEGLRYE